MKDKVTARCCRWHVNNRCFLPFHSVLTSRVFLYDTVTDQLNNLYGEGDNVENIFLFILITESGTEVERWAAQHLNWMFMMPLSPSKVSQPFQWPIHPSIPIYFHPTNWDKRQYKFFTWNIRSMLVPYFSFCCAIIIHIYNISNILMRLMVNDQLHYSVSIFPSMPVTIIAQTRN